MKFELKGYGLNNILRSLHAKKVKIFNLEIINSNHVAFEVDEKDEKKVKRQIANVKSTQQPNKIKRFKAFFIANVGILLGLFFGFISYFFLSSFTWQILVYGTKDLSPNQIVNVLKVNGVKKGKINTKTSQEIEQILLNNYDKLAQVSVIKQGNAIIINVSEKLVYKQTEFLPIVATRCGVIESINIITGTNNVKVGDFVTAGDVLVLPYNINQNGEKINVKPLAEIKATMFVIGKCELNKTETKLKPTGKTQKVYNYKLFNKKIFSKNKNSFALFSTLVYNENVSKLIPFTRDVVIYQELKKVEVVNDLEMLKPTLMAESVKLAYKNLPIYNELINETTTTNIVGEKLIACTTLTITGLIHD